VVLYRNQPQEWVAEIPAIHGCYALMATREEALALTFDNAVLAAPSQSRTWGSAADEGVPPHRESTEVVEVVPR
jgi:hypothetical protein